MVKNQKKYSKYFASAAAATLVAAAVAPISPSAREASPLVVGETSVVSVSKFPDTKGHKYEVAIEALLQAKIISGYPDGLFYPDKKLKRSDVVKILGKWLVAEGYKIPADAVSKPRFTDLTSTMDKELLEYAAIVKENGVFKGSNGRLMAGNDISSQQTALVIVRALDTLKDVDLAAYVAAQKAFKKDARDISTGKVEVREAIDVLDYFNITNQEDDYFNPNGFTTRGQFAEYIFKTFGIDFNMVKGIPAVKNITSLNSTTIEVAFEDVIKDIDQLTFTIDGLTVKSVTLKEDGKTIVLTTNKQVGGETYIVMLNGIELATVVSKPDTDSGGSGSGGSGSGGSGSGGSGSGGSGSGGSGSDGSGSDGSGSNPDPTPPPTDPNPGEPLAPDVASGQVNAAKTEAEVQNILKSAILHPAFSNLNATQQQEVAKIIFDTKKNFGNQGYNEYRLKDVYQLAYATQERNALKAVNLAKTEQELVSALKNAPGLNLAGYNAMSPAEKQVVHAEVLKNQYDTIATLQKAINDAKEGILAPILAQVNGATSGNALQGILETNKVALQLDTSNYDTLSSTDTAKVADALLNNRPAGGYSVESLQKAFVKEVNLLIGHVAPIFAEESIKLVNEERARLGLYAYVHDTELSRIAQIKAQDMIDNNYLGHNSPTYGNPGEMLTHFKYYWSRYGENLHMGSSTAKGAVDAWIASPGHYANIKHEQFRNIGAGYAVDARGRAHWVHIFATQ